MDGRRYQEKLFPLPVELGHSLMAEGYMKHAYEERFVNLNQRSMKQPDAATVTVSSTNRTPLKSGQVSLKRKALKEADF